jgi:hypothetical protein
VDTRCSVEGYSVWLSGVKATPCGYLLFGRPEATRLYPWYGSVPDILDGRCEVTRWQVLNLARVWIDPAFQRNGEYYSTDYLPGFTDRKGVWRSTLASDILKAAVSQIGFDYLMRRPPCFLDEPYEITWLLSYCDTRIHKGVIYASAGWQLYRVNKDGIQTWRIPLPNLTPEQHSAVRHASIINRRSQEYRARRAQMRLEIEP